MNLEDLVELADTDELLREIDRRCAQRDWRGVIEVRDRCERAVERGKQLWGVAAHAEYRLALEAPGEYAGEVVASAAGHFALGPLSEVAASTHEWASLRDHIAEGPSRAATAYECIARGEDLSNDASVAAYQQTFELPLVTQSWEPDYPQAVYKSDSLRADAPFIKALDVIHFSPGDAAQIERADDPELEDALKQLTQTWVANSNGRSNCLAVFGRPNDALTAMGVETSQMTEIDARTALALMAWAAASGGVHGRRSGLAAGRSKAWWAAANLTGLADEWPVAPSVLGEAINRLEWFTWQSDELDGSWSLRLAVVDATDGVTAAIESVDTPED